MAVKTFTGYAIAKCRNGHVTRFDLGVNYFRTTDANTDIRKCSDDSCDRSFRMAFVKPLYGSVSDKNTCGAKCLGAIGPSCDCQCGGKNHGAGHGNG